MRTFSKSEVLISTVSNPFVGLGNTSNEFPIATSLMPTASTTTSLQVSFIGLLKGVLLYTLDAFRQTL